ncbi:GL15782 [Drosophila persimilis]|uniref:GL15782 n=1 Tax=Drosophila persimilis TaxID=7234 RepID=B4H0V2_DROPE|nr:protein Turandot Z-like [Drosophila persimilis]XP_026850172.1 protein Turandot Z-like [Drosophila persimilis]EDW30017.1 GL15782 [Drosophila persimilis]
MSPLVRLSCVLALLVCLTGTISAGPIDDDRARLNQLLRNAEPADDAQLLANIQTAIALYKECVHCAADEHQVDDDLDREVKKFEDENRTVEGLPAQGGFWSCISAAADSVPDEVKDQAKELAKTSAKALFSKLVDYLKKMLN